MGTPITNDLPLTSEEQDKFQRYSFSKRIAESIVNRKESESIVIGLYGAWGEGKSTVLNFIRKEIIAQDPNTIQISFNPWRFTDEAALLVSFFNSLANGLMSAASMPNEKSDSLKEKVVDGSKQWFKNRKGYLKTTKETVGEIIKEYGRYISIFGYGEAAQTVGDALSSVDIDTLKSRIENLLIKQKKRIVIYIDDIDRLDKNEIYSVFRLVKLTGDFPFTTYLLSFDENMVATAISARYGSGDITSGINFLEKIIQVPLRLPLAQKSALKMFCFELVDKAVNDSNIVLSDEEAQEFTRKFVSTFLTRLSTPRLAVRYGNAISFALPLLKGEVNYVDLLLIEAMRVFYPEVYNLIRDNPDYFISEYTSQQYDGNQENSKIQRLRDLFSEKTNIYSHEQKESAQEAIQDLFPNVERTWSRLWSWNTGDPESRYQQRRISSSQYFNRYFSYTVIKGDVSDVAFSEFLSLVETLSVDELVLIAIDLIKNGSSENFTEKLRKSRKTYNNLEAISLVKVISNLGENFPDSGNTIFRFMNPDSDAALFIAQIIRNQVQENERFELVRWTIQNGKPFPFIYKVHNYCRTTDNDPAPLFTQDQYKILNTDLKDKALEQTPDKPIWESFAYESKFIINAWHHIDKDKLQEYIQNCFLKDPKSVISFLKMFTGPISSNVHPVPYSGDFSTKHYKWLVTLISGDVIFNVIKRLLGEEVNNVTEHLILNNLQTDLNIMKQFIYCHQHQDKIVQNQFG